MDSSRSVRRPFWDNESMALDMADSSRPVDSASLSTLTLPLSFSSARSILTSFSLSCSNEVTVNQSRFNIVVHIAPSAFKFERSSRKCCYLILGDVAENANFRLHFSLDSRGILLEHSLVCQCDRNGDFSALKVSTRQERAEKTGEDIRLEKKRDYSRGVLIYFYPVVAWGFSPQRSRSLFQSLLTCC